MSTRKHGTRSCYVMGCDRPECAAAAREYGNAYWRDYRRHLEGEPHVDPARAAAHVAKLRAAGMGVREIANACGTTRQTIAKIDSRSRGIRPETERRILAVRFDPYRIDATGARRRVRALACLGWTRQQIADAAGLQEHGIGEVMAAQVAVVYRTTDQGIRRAYDALSMRPGPSVRTRNRALAAGWAPPLAWDDEAIDNPAAEPQGVHAEDDDRIDEVAVERAVAGRPVRLTRAERDLALPRMAAAGMSDHVVADLLGITPETVLRNRRRLGVPGVQAAHVRAAQGRRAS